MKKEDKKKIDNYMGVEGILINSNLVSFQNRVRYYWTNIPNVSVPEDRLINFQNYIDTDSNRIKEATPNRTPSRIRMWGGGLHNSATKYGCKNITQSVKIGSLTTLQDRCPNSGMLKNGDWARYLTRREMELAQTLPIGYCDGLSYNQTSNVIGDGWTVDIISHIFSFIPKEGLDASSKS